MYTPQNFSSLIGTPGFSEALLTNHFTLYEGYVKNTNACDVQLSALALDGKFSTPEYNEIKRHFGWEYNGMRLHELYFSNMKNGGVTIDRDSSFVQKVTSTWGSVENWMKDFKATGSIRGIGWVVLVHDNASDKLFNVWVNEHDTGNLVGTNPILVMDVFEHAFMLDYGIKRAEYIEAFWNAIDWKVVAQRM